MNEKDMQIYRDEFWNLVHDLRDNVLRDFMEFFVKEIGDEYFSSPGSRKNHHGYDGGLCEHSVSIARLAWKSANQFCNMGIAVSKDIVVVGALLHDIGKIKAYHKPHEEWEYTADASMIYHIPLGYGMALELFRKFNEQCELVEHTLDEKKMRKILHIILSHHGNKAWGSPIEPQTPEALIVHLCDMMDAGVKKITTTGPYHIYHT